MNQAARFELISEPEPFGELDLDHEVLEGAAFAGLTPAERKALAITSTLETGERGGFSGLSGNFDGMGISFGLVNWNIGSGSRQPLLRELATKFPARFAAAFGPHALGFRALITPSSAEAVKAQLAFAKTEMNELRKVRAEGGRTKERWVVKEPW